MQSKFTVADYRKAKTESRKISVLTAYDFPTARIFDRSGIDSILVGDSLGMTVLGYEDTTKVTIEDMIHHTKAVARGVKKAMVITDMPFLSYHTGKCDSVRNAGRLLAEGGCNAVKLEGGENIAEDIMAIINAGIPVMGHLGYTPQSINVFGGHKAQGKTIDTARKIINDAFCLQQAGAFSVVLECIPFRLAELITSLLDIPTIGIGAGPGCDGQVLVAHDILGCYDEMNLRHSKKYLDLSSDIGKAVEAYILDVSTGVFPTEKNSFAIEDEVMTAITGEYAAGRTDA